MYNRNNDNWWYADVSKHVKMKIKPLTYELSQGAVASVENNVGEGTIDLTKSKNKRKSNTMVIVFKEPPQMNYYTPVIYKNELYAAFLPNPIHLFFAQAIEHANSVDRAVKLFPNSIEQTFNPETKGEFNIIKSDVYNYYLIYKISSVTSLIMAVESFINLIIPDNYEYKDSDKVYNKSDIERFYNLKEKITKIIPEIIKISNLSDYQKLYSKVIEINLLRNEFIHLKTKRDKKNGDPFIDHFESLINLDLNEKIDNVKDFINFLRPDYL